MDHDTILVSSDTDRKEYAKEELAVGFIGLTAAGMWAMASALGLASAFCLALMIGMLKAVVGSKE